MKAEAAVPMLLEALRIARVQIAADRDSLYQSVVSYGDEGEEAGILDAADRAAVGAYDQTLAFIDAAIAKATAP